MRAWSWALLPLLLVALGACGAVDPTPSPSAIVTTPTAGPGETPTASPTPALSAGSPAAFSDNFSPAAGWGANDSATAHDAYVAGGGYSVQLKTAAAVELVFPQHEPSDSEQTTVSVSVNLPGTKVGGGVFCRAQLADRGNVGVDVLYVDAAQSTWEIDHLVLRTSAANTRTTLASGALPAALGAGRHRLSARCTSGSDGTALALQLDGQRIGAATDTKVLAAGSGTSGIVAAADGDLGTVGFADFQSGSAG